MTTVGYGDVVPITPWGKVVGGLVGIIGIGMVALPAGLLASGFSDQLQQRRREFEVAETASWRPARSARKRATSSGHFAIGWGFRSSGGGSFGCSRTSAAPRIVRTAASRSDRRPPRAPPRQGSRRRIQSPRNSNL